MQTGVPAKPAANVARLARGYRAELLAGRARARPAGNAGLALAREVAHRPQPPSAVEEPGAAGQRRRAVLAAGDDPAAAAARQRAQLPLDDAAHRAAGAAPARASPRPGCRAPQVVALEYLGGYRVDAVDAASRRALRLPAAGRIAPDACRRRHRLAASSRANAAITSDDDDIDRACYRRAEPRQRCRSTQRLRRSRRRRRAAARRTRARRERSAGRSSPCRARSAMSSSPPWRCTTCLTIDRPSPVPPVSRERLPSTR